MGATVTTSEVPMSAITLMSLQIGKPRTLGDPNAIDPNDREWTSSIYKDPVEPPVWLWSLHLDGDGQADLENHGGEHMAVNAYPAAHYPGWRTELGLTDFPHGAFGENFTIGGQDETTACIGDVYRIGAVAEVEISQPRQPCWKLARRWRIKDLAARVQRTGRTGWYYRVRTEGYVVAGAVMELLARPFPQWTIAVVNEVLNDKTDISRAHALAECPALTPGWRDQFRRRA